MARPIAAGEFRHRVLLQSKQEHTNAMNEVELSWSDEMTLWADVRPLGNVERQQAMALVGYATHQVRVRGLEANITPDKRFVMVDQLTGRTHTLEVVGEMNTDMQSFEVRVACVERV